MQPTYTEQKVVKLFVTGGIVITLLMTMVKINIVKGGE